jgi:hypothetical protein
LTRRDDAGGSDHLVAIPTVGTVQTPGYTTVYGFFNPRMGLYGTMPFSFFLYASFDLEANKPTNHLHPAQHPFSRSRQTALPRFKNPPSSILCTARSCLACSFLCTPFSLTLPCCRSHNAFVPFLGPCLGGRRGDGVESVREHVEDDGTPSSGQFGLHCLCSVVPISVLLGAQVGCLDIAFIPFVAPVHQKHKMTRLPRQSVCHHPKRHRSIWGPGCVQTCNICSGHSRFICCSVPCVFLSPLRSRCYREGGGG